MEKKKTDVVISINVHEKPDYLMGQLANIRDNVKMNHLVLISANEYMYENIRSHEGFVLNPTPINKERHHGSLTRGIVSNMRLARETIDFDWFLVMSSRDFFYRPLSSGEQILANRHDSRSKDYGSQDWHWPRFHNSKLHEHMRKFGLFLSNSPHEGLCFDAEGVRKILEFLDQHMDIASDLFEFNYCVEEFALQSICCNFGDYYNIGNGTDEVSDEGLDPHKFTRKRPR